MLPQPEQDLKNTGGRWVQLLINISKWKALLLTLNVPEYLRAFMWRYSPIVYLQKDTKKIRGSRNWLSTFTRGRAPGTFQKITSCPS
jgi:hypothetical protein